MLSEKIKKARENAKMSKAEVARELKIPYTTYNNYETGFSEPKFGMVSKIASVLGVSIRQLILDEDEIQSHTRAIIKKLLYNPQNAISNWLAAQGYIVENHNDEIWIRNMDSNECCEIKEADLEELEKSTSAYTKFQIQELLSRYKKTPSVSED